MVAAVGGCGNGGCRHDVRTASMMLYCVSGVVRDILFLIFSGRTQKRKKNVFEHLMCILSAILRAYLAIHDEK